MSRLRQVFVIVTVWVVTTAGLCDFTPPPPQGQNVIPVDFSYQQTTYWCIPATIQMVTRWVAKREVATQAQIWSYSLSAYPADTTVGQGIKGFQTIANLFNYYLTGLPNGRLVGPVKYTYLQGQIALADQDYRLRAGHPTAVGTNNGTTDGWHMVLVVGSSWRRLGDWQQRPEAQWVKIHDPWPTGGPNAIIALNPWMDQMKLNAMFQCVGGCYVHWMPPEDYRLGSPSLQQFDAEGGVIAGPPSSNPTGRYRYDGNGGCYWDWYDSGDNQCSPATPGGSNIMSPGERLYSQQDVMSPNGQYRLTYQADGNLVLYSHAGAVWGTMSFGVPGRAEMQTDGNFVVYNSAGAPLWHSVTYGHPGAYLEVQDNGNVVVVAGGTVLWTTNTGAPSVPTGRYKWNGSQCYWDPNDSGANQCVPPSEPPTGRYKWSGSACYWDPNDSGPNQCTP